MVGPTNSRTRPGPGTNGEIWSPATEQDRDTVREQLNRLLASSVFMRSKGCSNLLSYVVNQALEGEAERLKERTIGVSVFGRTPDYDTATDHVVRSTAGEVRKRLAQYYMEAGRSTEVRIEIPSGSYVPQFVRPAPPLDLQYQEPLEIVPASPPAPPPQIHSLLSPRLVVPLGIAAVVLLSVFAISGKDVYSFGRARNGFWSPVLESPNPILVCMGAWIQAPQPPQPGAPAQTGGAAGPNFPPGAVYESERVFLDDAMALAKFTGWLQQSGKPYRVLPASRVTYADLQTSPAVLIGFNNYWTTNLAGRIRFTVERKDNIRILRDKKNPASNDWSVDVTTPYDQPTTDYALVVRAVDPKTGQVVITAAGLTHFGTLAAGEFLTNPDQLKKLDAVESNGWERKNIAIVLSTEVIKGIPGTPKIVTTDLW